MGFSTGNAKAVPISILDEIDKRKEEYVLDTKSLQIYMYHTKAIHHKNWDKPGGKKYRDAFERRMEYIFSIRNIEFDIVYPPEFDYHTLGENKNEKKKSTFNPDKNKNNLTFDDTNDTIKDIKLHITQDNYRQNLSNVSI